MRIKGVDLKKNCKQNGERVIIDLYRRKQNNRHMLVVKENARHWT